VSVRGACAERAAARVVARAVAAARLAAVDGLAVMRGSLTVGLVVVLAAGGALRPRAHEVARRHVLRIRVPGDELVEDASVAVQLQRVHRNAAVKGQDQLTGRAPGGGVGRVRVLAGSGGGQCAGCGEAGDPCAVAGKPKAPGAALGGVVIDDSGTVAPVSIPCGANWRGNSTASGVTTSSPLRTRRGRLRPSPCSSCYRCTPHASSSSTSGWPTHGCSTAVTISPPGALRRSSRSRRHSPKS
jgi:hypothetical protein